jgi:ferredoxin
MTTLHIQIDADLCAASAMCQRIAPDIFLMPDDADTAIVLTPAVTDPGQIRLAQEARGACPTQAISTTEA